MKELDEIKKVLHYPDCWDTMSYPTLLDAIKEIFSGCTTCGCAETTLDMLTRLNNKLSAHNAANPPNPNEPTPSASTS